MQSDVEMEILKKRGRTTTPHGSSEAVPPEAITAFVVRLRSAIRFTELLQEIQNGSGHEADQLIDRASALAVQLRNLTSDLGRYPGVSVRNRDGSEGAEFSDLASTAEEAYRIRISELVDAGMRVALEAGMQIDPDMLRLRWTEVNTENKLTTYVLDEQHPKGKHKARVFKAALGFTSENASEFARQIKFDPSKPYSVERKHWGKRDPVPGQGTNVSQVLVIVGANGRSMPVRCGWMIYPDGVVRFKTAFPA